MKKPARDPKGSASFPVPLYGGRVLLCLAREAYNKASVQLDAGECKGIDACSGLSNRHAENGNKSVYLIGVFDGKQSTMVHELVHTTFAVLAHAEVPISRRNDEAFAYLMDTLFSDSLAALRKIKRTLKPA